MSEYEVTPIADEELHILSGSRAELGDNAGPYTWNNCLEVADRLGDAIGLDYDDARDHFAEYGAWEREEIDAWSERELQALVIQEVAADLRELERGEESGRVFVADDGKVWIYLGV